MEENQRPLGVNVAQNFDDIFKSVEQVSQEQVTPQTEEKPIVEEKVVETTPIVEEAPKQTEFKKRLDLLIEDGVLENFAIGIPDENGERQEVFLSDLSEVDEETYKTILANYKEAKDKEIKEKYISTDGLDETTKKLIEIRKAGGNIDEIVKENVSAIDQWQKTKEDLTDNEQLQINVVAWDLKQRGLSDRVIEAQIKEYIDNVELDKEAEKIVDTHLSAHQQEIENKKNAELKRIEQEKEAQKQTRKNLSNTYKEWKLPEHLQKVLVDNATKVDESGLTNTEKLFFEAVKDPQKLAKISFLLNNEEEFEKFISGKKTFQAKTEGLRPLFDINLKSTKQVKSAPVTVEERYDDVFEKK